MVLGGAGFDEVWSKQVLQRIQSERFLRREWFAVVAINQFAPVGSIITKSIQEGWFFLWATRDELAFIATNCSKFAIPLFANVDNPVGRDGQS